jgi:anti-sigma B factor antagonist
LASLIVNNYYARHAQWVGAFTPLFSKLSSHVRALRILSYKNDFPILFGKESIELSRGLMKLKSMTRGDTLYIKVIGVIDTLAAENLKFEFREIILQKPKKVILDLSKVPTMGSLGVGRILMFYNSLRESNSAFEIQGIHENLYPFFITVKLDNLFPISQQDASSKEHIQNPSVDLKT